MLQPAVAPCLRCAVGREGMTLRLYADFNSRDSTGWCWCLRHNGRSLDEVGSTLDLSEGQQVVLFYEDSADKFEFDGVLSYRNGHWHALPDESSYRLLGDSRS